MSGSGINLSLSAEFSYNKLGHSSIPAKEFPPLSFSFFKKERLNLCDFINYQSCTVWRLALQPCWIGLFKKNNPWGDSLETYGISCNRPHGDALPKRGTFQSKGASKTVGIFAKYNSVGFVWHTPNKNPLEYPHPLHNLPQVICMQLQLFSDYLSIIWAFHFSLRAREFTRKGVKILQYRWNDSDGKTAKLNIPANFKNQMS